MLQVKSLTLTHRKDLRTIIRDFNLVLNRGDKAVLIGEEGNGKSTLLKWIYDPGLIDDYADAEGTRTTQGELLGYLPQELPDPDKRKTVFEYYSDIPAFQAADPSELRKTADELGTVKHNVDEVTRNYQHQKQIRRHRDREISR